MFPLLGSLIGGLTSIGFGNLSADFAQQRAKDMGLFNSELQLNTLAHSGNAQRQADKALGRSSAFAQNGISVPASSTPSPSPMPVDMRSFVQNMRDMSDMDVNNQGIRTGRAQENLLDEQSNTEIKKQEEIDANIEKLRADAHKSNKEADKIVLDSEAQGIINKYLDEQKSSEIRNLNMNSEKIDKELEIKFKKLPYELKSLAAAAYQANTQGKLNSKTFEFIGSQIKKIDKEIEGFQHIWDNLDADTKKKLNDADVSENLVRSVGSRADIDELEARIIKAHIPQYEKSMIADWFKRYRAAYNPVSFLLGRD